MSPENIVAIATGTAGLTAFLIYVVRVLWISHERQDADTRAFRDLALKGWQDQTVATDRLTGVVEKGEQAQTAAIEKLVNVLQRQGQANVLKGQPPPRDQS
jgi:hypothetical protein